MPQKRKTAIVICPGRGSYNKSELGYLQRHHADKIDLLASMDRYRASRQQASISELDQAKTYDRTILSRGDNASSLIYACAQADFLSIDQDKFNIVGITGNSMGWYVALACASSLNPQDALHLVNSMGNLMHHQQTGGQLIYPLVDENWQPIPGRAEALASLKHEINQHAECELHDSILLGGLHVFSGNKAALIALSAKLSPQSPYPLRLPNHGAFHSPIMAGIAAQAQSKLPVTMFSQPGTALIDGRGHSWQPHSSDPEQLWHYTLEDQIVQPYDYTRAVHNSVREFAPDCLIILGPGNSLGAVTAQSLIEINWQGLSSRQDFSERQQTDPFILSMGLDDQRSLCAVA